MTRHNNPTPWHIVAADPAMAGARLGPCAKRGSGRLLCGQGALAPPGAQEDPSVVNSWLLLRLQITLPGGLEGEGAWRGGRRPDDCPFLTEPLCPRPAPPRDGAGRARRCRITAWRSVAPRRPRDL